MKRKTNLFYTEGIDSKFITFSNYTESMTGNFLSTDTKLFPSRFLCLKIDSLYDSNILNEKKKSQLIKYLVCYYESKMAVLRDNEIKNNDQSEEKLLPLNYLIEALLAITNIGEESVTYDMSRIDSLDSISEALNDKVFDISYVSDITEQDYNGTYTDTICIVDINSGKSGKLEVQKYSEKSEYMSIDIPVYNENKEECLYGWENGIIESYEDQKTIFDKDDIENENKRQYKINSYLNYIQLFDFQNQNELSFNIIVPLFDITNINYKTSFSTIDDEKIHTVDKDDINAINLKNTSDSHLCQRNIPLGLWISDETVKLKKDVNTGFSQSWSLVISSQFKPFPYSKSIPSEVTSDSKSNSFATFAQILSNQNKILSKFENISYLVDKLSDRLLAVESQLKNVGTISNIDSLHKELLNYEQTMNKKFDQFTDDVSSYVDNIKWKTII